MSVELFNEDALLRAKCLVWTVLSVIKCAFYISVVMVKERVFVIVLRICL